MGALPVGLVVPTDEASLDARTNPINGRRGGTHPVPLAPRCTVDPAAPRPCLVATLDTLGFDVTSGSVADRERRVRQATEAVQLDAGLTATGAADEALLRYLAIWPGSEDAGSLETRTIGTSAQGRPITALRYGGGPAVVLVVAETHGDEEAGLRVWLRARTLLLPARVTVWVVPMLNPDGLALDTRFLADGTDPNRKAPTAPEQRAVHDFAVALHPVLTVWYHQN
jgi:hypothetical protein